MERTSIQYQTYVQILKEELVPAMGCTEPIALAYCAAKAKEVLGVLPERCVVEASGNIVKNVKSVIVPNTGGLKGIEAAAAAGVVAGDAGRVLEVIAGVTQEQKIQIKEYMEKTPIQVKPLETDELLDMIVTLYRDGSYAKVRIANYHTNIVLIEKDGEKLYEMGVMATEEAQMADRSLLNVKDIDDFARTVELEDVKELIGRQIEYNSAISKEGLEHDWGANIGSVLLKAYGDDIRVRARAVAAAGSDARMSGCEMPVIINSGSGNQGMTASLPVIEYAKELKVSEEELYRALVLSNLVTIHQKTGIGRLSAYCGAVSAGCGAGCGIAYLLGGDYATIAHTLVNALAIVSGIICDGAKPSCAGKIAAAVDAGILGYQMYINGQQFRGGDGIISKGVENTIRNVGRLGKEGMKETDKEIIQIMTDC
ncbi:MAG: serine dehydratase subunit alpha family protein [Lachnospiraceae bacterium]|jgi:L-cysteine desulfidase|nr:serine dehydratase subunit alpha family protein [Lachnospiraceae bacterium]MCI9283203.1 serine dehydratase subunit alpha family protein [Lachnospiraceae bacterium]